MALLVYVKLLSSMTVTKDEDDEVVKVTALSQDNVKTHTDGKNIVKVIVVKNKIVNVVVK